MLGLMNTRFGGDYLGDMTLLQAARARGYATAAIGKLGPTAIQDVTSRDGNGSIVIDDSTGSRDGDGVGRALGRGQAGRVSGHARRSAE